MLRFPVSDDRRVIVGFGGPGRVKTRSGKGGAESFSQLPSSESSCQHKPTLTSTQSRWKFYTEVGHRSFHTAWVNSSPHVPEIRLPLYPRKRTQVGHRRWSVSCQNAEIRHSTTGRAVLTHVLY